MLQSAHEWRSTPGEAQKFGLQQHPGKQNKTDLSTLNCVDAFVLKNKFRKTIQETKNKTKNNSYWRLDDENEDDDDDDGEDDDTV